MPSDPAPAERGAGALSATLASLGAALAEAQARAPWPAGPDDDAPPAAEFAEILDLDGAVLLSSTPAGPAGGAHDQPAFWLLHAPAAARRALHAAAAGRVVRFQAAAPAPDGSPQGWDVAIRPLWTADRAIDALLVEWRPSSGGDGPALRALAAALRDAPDATAMLDLAAAALRRALGPLHVGYDGGGLQGAPGGRLQLGLPVIAADVADAGLDPAEADGYRALGLRAVVHVPVMRGGRLVAALLAGRPDARAWTPGAAAFIRDAADCVWAAVARMQAEQAVQALARAIPPPPPLMLAVGFDGTIEAVNPAWTDLLGWSPASLIGLKVLDLIHPDDRRATAAQARRLQDGHRMVEFTNRYRHRDGSFRWISWTAAAEAGRIHAEGRPAGPPPPGAQGAG